MKTFTAIRLSVATLIGAVPVSAARRKLVRMLTVVGFAMSMFACAGQQVATAPPTPPSPPVVQRQTPAPRPTPPPVPAQPAPQPPVSQEDYQMRRMEVVCSLVGDYASIMVEGRDKGYSERAMLQLWYEELDKFNKATQQERAYVRSITPTIVSGIFSNSDLSKFNAKATAQVLCIMGPN